MFQAKNINDPERLMSLAEEMHKMASVEMTGDDPTAYSERLNQLCSLVATSGKALSDAKWHKNKAIKNSILKALSDTKVLSLPTSTLNELIKADAHDLNYLVDFIEQIDKDFKYQIEALRTLISLAKTEMSAAIYQR